MTPFTLNVLNTTIRLVSVPLSVSLVAVHDASGSAHLPLEQTMIGHIMKSLDRASTRSSSFFAINSNAREITIYASSQLVEDIWEPTSLMTHYQNDGLILSRSLWRVFQLECFDGSDIQDAVARITQCLADADISIQYQSSTLAEFVLVKEIHFGRALSLFRQQDWHVGSVRDAATFVTWAGSTCQEELELSMEARLDAPIISHGSIHQYEIPKRRSMSAQYSDRMSDTSVNCAQGPESTPGSDTASCIWEEATEVHPSSSISGCTTPASMNSSGDAGQPTDNQSKRFRPREGNLDGQNAELLSTQHKSGIFVERGNLAMVGLNREVEASWIHRLTRFLCFPEEFGSFARTLPTTASMAFSDQSEVDSLPDHAQAKHWRQAAPLKRIRPFFSYIRTGEGSSLLTDVQALQVLFPDRYERSLLVCNEGNMEDIEVDLGSVAADIGEGHVNSERLSERDTNEYYNGPMAQKCIRMDLGLTDGLDTLHLDRSGFLLRISQRLRMGQIKMLYISTYHSANIIVYSEDLDRAHDLLSQEV